MTAILNPAATVATDTYLADNPAIQLLRSSRNWLRAFVISWFIVLAIGVVVAVVVAVSIDKAASDLTRETERAECLARRTAEYDHLCN